MLKQFLGPLEGMSTHRVAFGCMIRIVDVTHVPVDRSTILGFMGRLLLSQKFPSAGGVSMLACELLVCPSKVMRLNLP